MIDFLLNGLLWVFPLDIPGFRSMRLKAYVAAWKVREQSGGTDVAIFVQQLEQHSVPGAYGPIDSPRLSSLTTAWELGMTPREARRKFGRDLDRLEHE